MAREKWFIWLQKCLPQHFLTYIIKKFTQIKNPCFKNFVIKKFIKSYQVNLTEAEIEDYKNYQTFNDFFIRKLKRDARPIGDGIISPVDGNLCHFGEIQTGKLLQAKGKSYALIDLLHQNQTMAQKFNEGKEITFYLAPGFYHRIHMPCAGTLIKMEYVSGKLFSVNPATVKHLKNIFCMNERVICYFETEQGTLAVILVAAMLVGGIQVQPFGLIKQSQTLANPISFAKGDELGFFEMGSTVILLFENKKIIFNETLLEKTSFKMGETIAAYQTAPRRTTSK